MQHILLSFFTVVKKIIFEFYHAEIKGFRGHSRWMTWYFLYNAKFRNIVTVWIDIVRVELYLIPFIYSKIFTSFVTFSCEQRAQNGCIIRGSCLQMFFKIRVLKYFAKALFFSKSLNNIPNPATFLQRDSCTYVFQWIFWNI